MSVPANAPLSTLPSPSEKVPVGYKQTEVGVIPEDWEVEPIGEFSIIKTGPFGTLLKASEYSQSHGVPLISVGEVREGFLRISEDTPRVSTKVTQRLPQYLLKEGDVVFGRKGGVERSALIKKSQDGWFLGSDGISIRPSAKLSAPYLGFQFQSHRVKEWLLQNAIGTTMASLNQVILKNALVALPSTKAEQEAIAEALSDADAWIESLEQLIAKKRRIKEGSMQALLTGKRRLPGFSGEWEEKTLGELADIRSGGTPSTTNASFWSGRIPWCTPTDITALNGAKYLRSTERKISSLGLKASSAELLPVSTVIMTSRATIGECAIAKQRVTTNQGFKNFIPFKETDVEFLYYMLTTHKEGFICLCGGSTFLEIGKSQLSSYIVSVPEKAEQAAIAEVLSDMDAEIESLESKLSKARQIKQGMMQELLTGKTRLV